MAINIELAGRTNLLSEVKISANKSRIHESTQMSSISITSKEVKKIPAILGEPDLIKALTLMPGVHSGNEGSAGFYVRGGGPDQNLILLDGAPLYNTTHLFGFFSTFSPEAINNVTLIKGGFPARYGGRLASVLDISMKEGNMKEFHGEVSVGILASRLFFEGPIIKNKMSFMVSARRTYMDLWMAPLVSSATQGNTTPILYFYDLNTKLNYKISDKDHLFASMYNGKDKFGINVKQKDAKIGGGMGWGNLTSTLRWTHIINPKLFMNSTVLFSNYNYAIEVSQSATYNNKTSNFKVNYLSKIEDLSAKVDFEYCPSTSHHIRFGANHTLHTFIPGVSAFKISDSESKLDTSFGAKPFYSQESHAYFEDDVKINNRLKANIGLHFSSAVLRKKFFPFIEPRIALRYLTGTHSSIKASYTVMRQYLHLLSNSNVGLPSDLWVPATDKIAPQWGWQGAIGYAQSIIVKKQELELSVEGFYKEMMNVIIYKQGASFFLQNKSWEDMVEIGRGNAYGAEFLAQKKNGKLTGWVGYTLSWTNRQFNNINNGKMFPYRYDRRHDISIVAMYDINKKISISATWVYGTGNSITLPEYQYTVEGGKYPYSVDQANSINGYKMPATHRLDLNISVKKQKKYGEQTWMFGVYNVYNRQNAFFIYRGENSFKQVSIFPIIPSVSYNFKF